MKYNRFNFRFPLNQKGKYYTDDRCIDCDFCKIIAPHNFGRHSESGFYFVSKQPSEDELTAFEEALRACPTDAIHDDGDKYRWEVEPMLDWNRYFKESHIAASVVLQLDLIPYDACTKDGKYQHDWNSGAA